MPKIRVLVVDDSVVVRKLLSEILSTDPEIEVVGIAANGRIALSRIPQVNPDLVVLDVEMPEMDGLETLAEIRKTHPDLPVIMFSTLTERGAATTIDALALGATDYVAKPSRAVDLESAKAQIRHELISRIKAFCSPGKDNREPDGAAPRKAALSPASRAERSNRKAPEIVAIGVSTGGPNALAAILPALPVQLPVPIVIVQHMPPLFTKFLADRLSSKSAIDVSEAANGTDLRPARAFLAPGDYHMIVERRGGSVRLALHQGPPENSCRPAADVLFRSVADVYGDRVLAVVLTGMGQDGLRGCERIREAGGQVLAQDQKTSVVWGMPGFVAKAGLADEVVPLGQVARRIVDRVTATPNPAPATDDLPSRSPSPCS